MNTYDKESYEKYRLNDMNKQQILFIKLKIFKIAYVNCEWRTMPNLYSPLLYFYLLYKLIVNVILYIFVGIPFQIFRMLKGFYGVVCNSFPESIQLEAVFWVINSVSRLKINNNYLKKYGKTYEDAPVNNGIVDKSTDGRTTGKRVLRT